MSKPNRGRVFSSAAALGPSASKGSEPSAGARGRAESSGVISSEKKKVRMAEEPLGNGDVDPTESISAVTVGKTKNFFDYEDTDTDVWGPKFTTTLRKSSKVFETTPFIPDTMVEKIGGAFVDEDRSLKPLLHRGTSRVETDSPPLPPSSLSLSSISSSELDRVKELERRVEELEIARWKAPPISDTINRLLLGKTCSLSWYKSMEAKRELLNQAIATLDGNCIMAVVLFIKKSVDQSIMLNILEHYPVAAQHYINFLKKLKDWKELRALYRRLGQYDNLGYFCLQECSSHGLDKDERHRRIKSCVIQFKALQLVHVEDVQHVEDYSRLSNKQQRIEEAAGRGGDTVPREGSVLFQPLTNTLLYCLRHHRGQERATGNPEELRKLFNIPERQYFQMELLALALRRDWQAIGSMLTTKGVLGFGKKKKSPIGFERVVRLLGQDRYRAPDLVLKQYLEEVDELEVRYQLAMEVCMYDAALDTLKALKDGERVRGFLNYLPPVKHHEYKKKIDQLLSNSQIKWKT